MAESVSVPIFDTQRAVEDLVAAGMPPEQAVGVVRLQAHWVDRSFATGEDVERLRTDVNGLRGGLEAKIESQGAEIGKDMARLREDLDRLRLDLEAKIESQGAEIGKDMARLRLDLEAKIESQGAEIGKDMARLRGDLDRLRLDLEAKIESQGAQIAKDMAGQRVALESKIEARSTALEARILASGITTTRWVTGTQVGTSAIFLAALLAALKL